MRRAVETLAAFVVGGVLTGPLVGVLTYAVFDPLAFDPLPVVVGTVAIALLALGVAWAFALPPGVRGWPAAAGALGVVLLLRLAWESGVGLAEVDLGRLPWALAAGVALGSVAAAALGREPPVVPGRRPSVVLGGGPSVVPGRESPVVPGGGLSVVLGGGPSSVSGREPPVVAGREPSAGVVSGGAPWAVAGLAAGMFAADRLLAALGIGPGTDIEPILAVAAAAVAALVTRGRPPAAAPPGLVRAVTVVAAVGAVLTIPFHSGFVEWAAIHRGSALYLGVGLLAGLWAGVVFVLVRWAGRRAGPTAARFALTVAGGAAALTLASVALDVEEHRWIPVVAVGLGALGAMAGVRWSGARAVAAGLVAVSLLGAGLIVLLDGVGAGSAGVLVFVAVLAAAGAFTTAALLAASRASDVPYGVVALLVSAPVMGGVGVFVGRLTEPDEATPLVQLTWSAPAWIAAIGAAVLLFRRPARPARILDHGLVDP